MDETLSIETIVHKDKELIKDAVETTEQAQEALLSIVLVLLTVLF